ncbi:hypothetical protein HQ945_21730 [Phyllobacterium sp. BT25]|uniref:Lipoprotein n=1 Tax=Phyllobacterium pellucidum TaxID=2740464 RepID=A0A849VV67_9HYPH|nr:hypothetical protein [Phyllobacterium pellucidum]NTS33885.1 hypothetical protein [Phyllobacterium pellucidum]
MKANAIMLALLGVFALTGCASRPPLEQMSYGQLGQLAGAVERKCLARGFGLDTPEYKACTVQEITQEQYSREFGSESLL